MHFSFDFDYTLADSSGGTIECASFALEAMHRQVPAPSTIRRTIGRNLPTTFAILTGDEDAIAAQTFEALFLEHADRVMAQHIRIYDGVGDCLARLDAEGHIVTIVSTKTAHRIRSALEDVGLQPLVELVIGGDDVANHKPDPEGLLRAMARTASRPEQTVYVGDSIVDAECAQRAGVRFSGVRSGVTPPEQLARWHPWHLLDSVVEIPAVMAKAD